jgi:hypothetical protein
MLAGFVKGANTTCTNLHTLSLALIHQHHLLDIGFPLPIRRLVRVAHIVTKLRALTTNLTFCHLITSLYLWMVATGQQAQ